MKNVPRKKYKVVSQWFKKFLLKRISVANDLHFSNQIVIICQKLE
jgi:hypothetical protein